MLQGAQQESCFQSKINLHCWKWNGILTHKKKKKEMKLLENGLLLRLYFILFISTSAVGRDSLDHHTLAQWSELYVSLHLCKASASLIKILEYISVAHPFAQWSSWPLFHIFINILIEQGEKGLHRNEVCYVSSNHLLTITITLVPRRICDQAYRFTLSSDGSFPSHACFYQQPKRLKDCDLASCISLPRILHKSEAGTWVLKCKYKPGSKR